MDLFANPITFIPQLFIFLGTFVLLSIFIFYPYLKIYYKRQELTTNRFAKVELINQQLLTKKEELAKKLKEVRQRALLLRKKIREEAKAEEKKILLKAREESNQFYAKAIAQLEKEYDKALAELSAKLPEHQQLIKRKIGIKG